MEALREIWEAFDFSYLISLVISAVPALLCITFHELCHGLTAYALGDDTAKKAGRLTLNPVKHIDIAGLFMLLAFHVGWAKPVPVNMFKFKNPKRGMAVTALAGPLSNILLAVVFLFFYGLLYYPCRDADWGKYISDMFVNGAVLSVGLAVFNLIPVPPLDGSKVLFSFLSNSGYYKLMKYEKYFSLAVIALVATGVIRRPLSAAIKAVLGFLSFFADLGAKISVNFI